MEEKYAIEMEHISKSFPGIKANDDITIRVKHGEIHALLGENGAGKSTLMSVLFGMYTPDTGCIKKDGEVITIKDPKEATSLGIGMVHQHFKLVDVFTVLENIILGNEPTDFNSKKGNKFTRFFTEKIPHFFGFINKNTAKEKIIKLSNQYGLNIDLDAKIEDISVGMQQRTEILKMLYRDNDVLIFDEPTAVLTPQEIEELLKIMKSLASEGKAILFISHKLNEIMEVADTCTVLRKGKLIKTLDIKDTNVEELSQLMVGREVDFNVEKKELEPGEEVLRVNHLKMIDKVHKTKNIVDDISFNVRRNEIVCIAGIDGNGQSDAIYGITGIEKIKDGNIYLNNEDITNYSIFKRNNKGISHIPEDRHKYGLILDYDLQENMIVENYWKKNFSTAGFLRKKAIKENSDRLIDKYDVRSGEGSNSIVRSMSGGNQQKAIIAREIDRDTDLLIAVQPTRGLDVGAIEYIHSQLVAQRDNGKAILLVSFELDEVMAIADRILVMFEGKIVGELNPKETTVEEIGLYMVGAKNNYKFNEEGGKQ